MYLHIYLYISMHIYKKHNKRMQIWNIHLYVYKNLNFAIYSPKREQSTNICDHEGVVAPSSNLYVCMYVVCMYIRMYVC